MVIVDYKAGNLTSVARALRKLGVACRVSERPEDVAAAERVVFPGVGAAGAAMADLQRLGLDSALRRAFADGKPILGICIGAQIVLERSKENLTDCLGLLPGEVRAFPPDLADPEQGRLKIPHMGWNGVRLTLPHPVTAGLRDGDEFYFVHSYYPRPSQEGHVFGTTRHGMEFASIIGYKNLIATQFHVEKSGPPGLRMLADFCRWDGRHAE